MTEPIAYLKGEFVPAKECKLPVFDFGIVLGAAVTDFLRTFNLKPFRMEEHVRRLYRSCKYARIEPPVSFEESLQISRKLIEHNGKLIPLGCELGIVYYMTAGENAIYAGAAAMPDKLQPTYVQHSFVLPCNCWRDSFLTGVHCITPAPSHWPPQCLSSKIKHRNRLHMWIGDYEVHRLDPKAVSLFLDIHGNITETGGSNFVIYRNNTVVSPQRANILWGESLEFLAEILADMKIPFMEQDIQVFDVVNAEEAWLPSSPYCLAPVVKINGTPIGIGKPGPLWRKIIDRWSDIVKKDIYKEFAEAL
jgi:branched-chain amino acid aminotransferase